MTPHQTDLAEKASMEMDPDKLMKLVADLCRALDSECTPMTLSNAHVTAGTAQPSQLASVA
jgi:hypothetical protein